MSGFYLNELLLKLTERCDPHPEIFASYAACIAALCAGEGEEAALRRFEKRLLDDLGYGLELSRTDEGRPVEPDRYYRFAAQRGPQPCVAEAPGAIYGRSLADLDAETFADARSLRDAKRVLRAALDACLDGRALEIARGHARHAAARTLEPGGAAVSGAASMAAGIALGVNIDHVATLRQARRVAVSGSGARRAARRAVRRGQHHAAPARGSPAHPGPRRHADAPGSCRRA